MSEVEIETARLLARFKLQVRRQLDRTVDLGALMADPAYADRSLSEIEDLTEDEDLLVMVLRLRERLVINRPEPGQPSANDEPAVPSRPARDYRFGARGG